MEATKTTQPEETRQQSRRKGRWLFIILVLAAAAVWGVADSLIRLSQGGDPDPYRVALGVIIGIGAVAALATLLSILAQENLW
jgi:drug/metabolite transporter (DMT)-like permease